ncbi:hypothetical protein F183_A14230 [Bryobacterales bacterium F-183]|nr:hypothetical protein F183_A14230 [Bryobacterales bacterium F-183]
MTIKHLTHFRLAFVCAFSLAWSGAQASGQVRAVSLSVTSVTVQYDKGQPDQITIYGDRFGTTQGVVELGLASNMTPLPIALWQNQSITAAVPVGLKPGTYVVRVTGVNPTTTNNVATIDVTIGTQGPQGERGAPGPAGIQGPQGIPGTIALAGKVCPAQTSLTGFSTTGELICTPVNAGLCARIDFVEDASSQSMNGVLAWPGGIARNSGASKLCSVSILVPSGSISNPAGDTWSVVATTGYSTCGIKPLPPVCGPGNVPGTLQKNGRPYCPPSAASTQPFVPTASLQVTCVP